MLFRGQAVIDDDRHFRLQSLGAMDGVGLDRQFAIQLRLDGLQGFVAPAQHQHRRALVRATPGDVFALSLDFLQQLRQARLQVEALHHLHAVVAGLHGLEGPAGLGLLEGHTGQHRLAGANDWFD
ncbi:hypothetical protein FQZ97_1203640 [compost metagenome]